VVEKSEGDFWITMQGNCLDTAVLEWCKLFGEKKGEHSWHKIVNDPDKFKSGLLKELKITEEIWESKVRELRDYRDTFIAHLDSEETMNIPEMDLPFEMIRYYFNVVFGYENALNIFRGIPKNLSDYYIDHYDEAVSRTITSPSLTPDR
jgi:hypothetical protein